MTDLPHVRRGGADDVTDRLNGFNGKFTVEEVD